MGEYNFTIMLRLPSLNDSGEQHLESFLNNGCDDATIAIGRPGYIHLDFGREAHSATEAVFSAVSDVQSAVPKSEIVAVGPDLVNLTDLADIVGCSRQNMRRYVSGEAKTTEQFPPPAASGDPALWRLVEVLPWLMRNTSLRPDDLLLQEVAYMTFSQNQSLQENRVLRADKAMHKQAASIVLTRRIAGRILHNNSQEVNVWKIAETVTRLAGSGVSKTKLNKLMFYSDFVHYQRYGVSITNLVYVRLPLGPVPDAYKLIFSALEEAELVVSFEEMRGPYPTEIIKQVDAKFEGYLTANEVATINDVRTRFEMTDATTIVGISHREPGWLETAPGNAIDYQFARRLLALS